VAEKKTSGADRRRALKTFVVAGAAVGCGALGVPAVRFVLAPVSGGAGSGRWIPTVKLASLQEGVPVRVELVSDHADAWTLEKHVQLGAAWLVRKGEAVVAWSTVCPHLGCAIDKSASNPGFVCPCHDSAFDTDGNRLSGPSPRALDSLATKLADDGTVMVEFRRFRQGTPDKVAVG